MILTPRSKFIRLYFLHKSQWQSASSGKSGICPPSLTTTLSEAYATYEGFYIVQNAGENNIVNIVARNGSAGQNDAIFRGIRNPENDNDAANKAYVDQHAGGGSGDFKADGSVTATGDFNMDGHAITNVKAPVNDTDVANKQYIDTEISDAVTEAQNVYAISPTDTLQEIHNIQNKLRIFTDSGACIIVLRTDTLEEDKIIVLMLIGDKRGSKPYYSFTQIIGEPTQIWTEASQTEAGFRLVQHQPSNHVAIELQGNGVNNHCFLTNVDTPTEDYDAANKKYVDDAIASAAGTSAFTVTASTTLSQIASAANDGAVIHVNGVTVDSVAYNGVATVSNDGTNISVTCGDLYVRGTGTQTLANATTRWKFSEMINTTVLSALYGD